MLWLFSEVLCSRTVLWRSINPSGGANGVRATAVLIFHFHFYLPNVFDGPKISSEVFGNINLVYRFVSTNCYAEIIKMLFADAEVSLKSKWSVNEMLMSRFRFDVFLTALKKPCGQFLCSKNVIKTFCMEMIFTILCYVWSDIYVCITYKFIHHTLTTLSKVLYHAIFHSEEIRNTGKMTVI